MTELLMGFNNSVFTLGKVQACRKLGTYRARVANGVIGSHFASRSAKYAGTYDGAIEPMRPELLRQLAT